MGRQRNAERDTMGMDTGVNTDMSIIMTADMDLDAIMNVSAASSAGTDINADRDAITAMRICVKTAIGMFMGPIMTTGRERLIWKRRE